MTPSSLPSTKQGNIAVVLALITDGFTCDFPTSTCTPCGSGSYGNTDKGVCTPCPAGKKIDVANYYFHLKCIRDEMICVD